MFSFDSLRKKIILILFLFFIPFVLLMQFYFLPTVEEKIVNGKKDSLKIALEIAIGVIQHFDSQVEAKKITIDEAKVLALQGIKGLRYHEKEYFWIHGLDLKMVMHPIKAELDGTNISG